MPKPFLTYEQQLVKLRDEKHIVIADEAGTLCKLQQVGYYSLVSGYKHLFRLPAQKIYKDGTAFEELVSLYEFDEALRGCFFIIFCTLSDTSVLCFPIILRRNTEKHKAHIF